jgi:hypothetical protein
VLQLKSAYRDGATHILMSPLQFMQRLAALVPRPRLHLIRFHGVLAPNAKLRCVIVPGPAENTSEHAADHVHAQRLSARMSWARPPGPRRAPRRAGSICSSRLDPQTKTGCGNGADPSARAALAPALGLA